MKPKYIFALSPIMLALSMSAQSAELNSEEALNPTEKEMEVIRILGSRTQRISSGATGLGLDSYDTPQSLSIIEKETIANYNFSDVNSLFKQVTGTPIRRFRLWQRIFVTSEKLSTGLSLTDAAIEAGFSDYAHFSRTFRELGGGNPSDARDNTEIRMLAS